MAEAVQSAVDELGLDRAAAEQLAALAADQFDQPAATSVTRQLVAVSAEPPAEATTGGCCG